MSVSYILYFLPILNFILTVQYELIIWKRRVNYNCLYSELLGWLVIFEFTLLIFVMYKSIVWTVYTCFTYCLYKNIRFRMIYNYSIYRTRILLRYIILNTALCIKICKNDGHNVQHKGANDLTRNRRIV